MYTVTLRKSKDKPRHWLSSVGKWGAEKTEDQTVGRQWMEDGRVLQRRMDTSWRLETSSAVPWDRCFHIRMACFWPSRMM